MAQVMKDGFGPDGISGLTGRASRVVLTRSLLPREDTHRPGSTFSQEPDQAGILILDFQPPEL